MFEFEIARDHMVESQIRTNDVTNIDLLRAFRRVKREAFTPKSKMSVAYADVHVELDDGRYMIRPRDFAKMVHAADVQPTDVVLDIACGRGYSTAILASVADTVVGLEDDAARVERATQLLMDNDAMNAAVIEGDLQKGASEHGPFDVIFVNGAVADVPNAWIEQLNDGGRLVAVIDDGHVGRACVFTKAGEACGERVVFDAQIPELEAFKPAPEFVF